MNAAELGSPDWWAVVMSMPLQERVDYLNGYKFSLLEQHGGAATHSDAVHKLSRVNHEIKKANVLLCQSQWQKACRQVLTEEQFAAVAEAKRVLEGWV
jgi:hypothetical protein